MFCLLFAFQVRSVKKATQLSDEDLIEQIVATGKDVLVEVLYERYVDRIYRRCLAFVKDNAIAEDLTHDIFIKVYLNLSSFQRKSKFSTWVYSIIYNFCVDYMRRHQKGQVVEMEMENVSFSNKDIENTDDLNHIAVEHLSPLLDQLKPDDRLILLMKYRDDLSIKFIQETFNISESAVKMRLKRAKEKIKLLYEQLYAQNLR